RLVVEKLQEAPDLVVEVTVIRADDLLVRTIRVMEDVFRVVVLPESVLDAIQADLDKLKIVPLGLPEIVPHDLKVLAAHRVDLVKEPALVLGPEVLDVDRVFADDAGDLTRNTRRMSVVAPGCIGSQEAADGDPVDLAGGVIGGD